MIPSFRDVATRVHRCAIRSTDAATALNLWPQLAAIAKEIVVRVDDEQAGSIHRVVRTDKCISKRDSIVGSAPDEGRAGSGHVVTP